MEKIISSAERKSVKTGLTLGKFAPLHNGHRLVIETAIKEMDHVIVVIYHCPETTAVSLPARAAWIRKLYPSVEVIEAWDGPADMGDTPEIKLKQETFILKVLRGRRITHFYSSEFYGEHMSSALGAVDRRVDSARAAFNVSGTQVRSNPFEYRNFLDPIVYRDLVTKAVFLGAPSTGKTTLAQSLAGKYKTLWTPEYGREYWEKHQVGRRLTPEQLVEIARGHIEREDETIKNAREYVFIDTNAMTTYLFAMYYHGFALPELRSLAEEAASRYDHFFLCDTDIPYDDTWDRSGEVNRSRFQESVIKDLESRKIRYDVLTGTLADRTALVEKKIRKHRT